MRRPAQSDRTAPQRCGAALFFSAGTGHAANKKSPGGLAGPSGARQRRVGPLPQGIAINMRFWGSNFLGESLRNVMHGPKGQRGVCPGPPAQRQGRRLSGPPRSPPKDKGSAGGPSRRPARTGHPAAPAPPPPPIQTGCNRPLPPLPEAGPRGSPPWRTPPRPAPGC